MSAPAAQKLTVEEILDIDDAPECGNEFHDGEIFPITDLTREHGVISSQSVEAVG